MLKKTLLFGFAAFVFYSLFGCAGSGLVADATRSYLGTQAPGDVWDWTISKSTFSATNETNGFIYSGTKSVLSTGFLKLVITSTTDPNVAVGQAAYALELPGTAMIIKPAGADALPPIVACSLGSNPPGPTVSFNFVAIPKTGQNAQDEAYGHVTYTVAGNDYQGQTQRFAIDGTSLPSTLSHFVGDHGRMTNLNGPNGTTTSAAMTPSGVCALDYGPLAGGAIGVLQPAQDVDLAGLAMKSYRGFLIDQGKTQCVSCAPNGNGALHGSGYANPDGVETGVSDGGSGVTVTFSSQPNPGLVKIDLSSSGGSESLVAAVNVVAGKTMLFGYGLGGDGKGYNFLLVEN